MRTEPNAADQSRGWAARPPHQLSLLVRRHRLELLAVLLLIAVAGIAHGVNMGNFPYYEDDEGTYVSQAWSVLREGQLAPYYYIYDHPPAGCRSRSGSS